MKGSAAVSWSASIRVVGNNGTGVAGQTVKIYFPFWYGIGTEYTDDDGWAVFEVDTDRSDFIVDIAVNHQFVAESVRLSDGDTMSFTIDR